MMIYKNFKSKVKNYWKKLDNERNFTVPNETIFNFLSFAFLSKKLKNLSSRLIINVPPSFILSII